MIITDFKNIKTNYNLAKLTTFGVGGDAKYFLQTDDIEEIQSILKFCKNENLKFKIIGGGSNLLISDDGYDGLILKIDNKNIHIDNNIFSVGAGVLLRDFVNFVIKNSYVGCDFIFGIPGTIGGAIYGNAGSFGGDISNIIKSVRFINSNSEIKELDKKECKFFYRESIFKHHDFVIFDAKFDLPKGDVNAFKKIMLERIKLRNSKQPWEYKSAGSFFKNVEINNDIRKNLENILDLSKFIDNIPAGFLIESVGLKGFCIGDAQASEKHANFLINKGDAKAKDIYNLAKIIKEKIKKEYNINLKEEVQYLGF
ncbi:MAG: UDP-N-acetylmuramate dehydrogenase [Patescibacteria group bacterium]|nr:UDP-N-acetylmuramate dehydrogenase [Patescibacteria group bacterium]MDD4304416.1 UDP-N-acetylmuramate dehydrogenase [Patescibacteria group bacterium]MDD4695439.1 UDP-N-acetylmuramate dehydrogenase [Patescibacteria group bacterium]